MQNLYSRTLGDQYIDPRMRLSNLLMRQGTDTSPIAHPMQGVARLAQTLAGMYMRDQSQKALAESNQAYGAEQVVPDVEKTTVPTDEVLMNQAYADPKFQAMMRGDYRNNVYQPQKQAPITDDFHKLPELEAEFREPDVSGTFSPGIQNLQDAVDLGTEMAFEDNDPTRMSEGVVMDRVRRLNEQYPGGGLEQASQGLAQKLMGGEFSDKVSPTDYEQQMADYINTARSQQTETEMVPGKKLPPMDFAVQQMRSQPNNIYSQNRLSDLLRMKMAIAEKDRLYQRGRTDKLEDYQRGLTDSRADATMEHERSRLPMSEGQFEQKKSLVKPTRPKTVTTAEGVYILNDDNTLGPRLGTPHSQFGYGTPSTSGTNQKPQPQGGLVSPTTPWDHVPIKQRGQMQSNVYSTASKALEKNRLSLEKTEALTLGLKRFKYLNSIQETGSYLDRATDFSTDPEKREMVKIVNLLTPQMRQGMPGAASDRDVAMFRGATVGIDTPKEINDAIISGMLSMQENRKDRQSFMEQYLDVNGHLQGAEARWKQYLEANPIFDPNAIEGSYQLNEQRQIYSEYFGIGQGGREVKQPDNDEGWSIKKVN